jgi:ketosteroid isomerase-like protein
MKKDPKLTVLEFNHFINNQDIKRLSKLMSGDHKFIDSSDEVHEGKELMVAGWQDFFESYPDYINHFRLIESRGNQVYVLGHSTCSHEPLHGPAIWTAVIENELVKEWRVYLDTAENREKLKLPNPQ